MGQRRKEGRKERKRMEKRKGKKKERKRLPNFLLVLVILNKTRPVSRLL